MHRLQVRSRLGQATAPDYQSWLHIGHGICSAQSFLCAPEAEVVLSYLQQTADKGSTDHFITSPLELGLNTLQRLWTASR